MTVTTRITVTKTVEGKIEITDNDVESILRVWFFQQFKEDPNTNYLGNLTTDDIKVTVQTNSYGDLEGAVGEFKKEETDDE